MKPGSAKARFLKRLEAAGHSLDGLTPTAGIEAMLEFYADERADGCDPENDGDMLLFQWGRYDWGNGAAFEVNITRQFIVSDDEDEPRQLSLTFQFDPGRPRVGSRTATGGASRWKGWRSSAGSWPSLVRSSRWAGSRPPAWR